MKKLLVFFLLLFAQVTFADIILVSDRLNFTDSDIISTETVKKKVLHFSGVESIDDREWLEAIAGKEVAVLIHGYNNAYDEALDFCSKIIKRSEHLYDTFICYLWPGGDQSIDYFDAQDNVAGILPARLLKIIEDLDEFAESADIFAHSLGCRIALDMLRYPSGILIRNAFLWAAAVDNESLEEAEIYHDASRKCEYVFVFHSRNDKVLGWAYPIVHFDRALGGKGAEDSIELLDHVYQIDCTPYVESHGAYADSKFVFRAISYVLSPVFRGES